MTVLIPVNDRLIQSLMLQLYKAAVSTGLLETKWGGRIFQSLYFSYKLNYEASHIGLLEKFVPHGTSVVDVGANLGYFTLKFAHWVGSGGKVLSIEPERSNLCRLKQAVVRARLTDIVEIINAAAAEQDGEAFLEINPLNPGDHKLAEAGIPVNCVRVDTLLRTRGWPVVSLIKIDVQGAEKRVLLGAAETIEKYHPALFVEVDDELLRRFGSDANDLLQDAIRLGYSVRTLSHNGISEPYTLQEIVRLACKKRYMDVLLTYSI